MLFHDVGLSPSEIDSKRRAWAIEETSHLRETRLMKVRTSNALQGKNVIASRYEVVKVLGKGSFGVVRLVREKAELVFPLLRIFHFNKI
jgi:protein-serine/threonine kinase